jgi:hypothetical protein
MNLKVSNPAALKGAQMIDDWITREAVKEFFNYGNTKMSTFSTDHKVRMARVGNRVFYRYSDIVKMMDENIVDQ